METRLAQFMRANGITNEQLATTAGVAISTVEDVRRGRTDPKRPTIVWLPGAATRLLRRTVKARELFDLGDDE
jgi:transcriptional regulator with XRE-family HTH domain